MRLSSKTLSFGEKINSHKANCQVKIVYKKQANCFKIAKMITNPMYLHATEKFIVFINQSSNSSMLYIYIYVCTHISLYLSCIFLSLTSHLSTYLFSYHLSVVKVNLLKVNIYIEEKSSLFSFLSHQKMS